MRHFNTTGPVNPADHYCIPPLERFDLDAVLALVRMKKYFVLHAPRQTGKTSALLALRDLLNGQGYQCLYTTVEAARTARDDVQRAMRAVLAGLGSDARLMLGDDFLDGIWPNILAESGPDKALGEALGEALTRWAEAGHLVVIDQREGRSWEEKVFRRQRRSKDGTPVEVWGM